MKHVVLFSGGLDSWVTLAVCKQQHPRDEVLLCFCDTASRIAGAEKSAARRAAKHYQATVVVNRCEFPLLRQHLLWTPRVFLSYNDTPLRQRSLKERSFVLPYRNVMLLGQAVLCAGAWGAGMVWVGFDYEYRGGSALDKSPAFVRAWDRAVQASAEPGCAVVTRTPLQGMSKRRIIERGLSLHVPFHKTFSCYNGTDGVGCAVCPSCVDRLKGFAACGLEDPAPYSYAHVLCLRGGSEVVRRAWRRYGKCPVLRAQRHIGWRSL